MQCIEDPTCPSHEATSEQYNYNVTRLLEAIRSNSNQYAITIATNNARSMEIAREMCVVSAYSQLQAYHFSMSHLSIDNDDANIWFGQVYGFVDHLSHSLGAQLTFSAASLKERTGTAGYNCYKSTPYGAVEEWLPYLCRRATESHSAFVTARTDLPHYTKALKRRLLRF